MLATAFRDRWYLLLPIGCRKRCGILSISMRNFCCQASLRRVGLHQRAPVIPPFDPQTFGIIDPDVAAWIKTKLTPHPFQTYFDNLALKSPLGNGVPATYIACINPRYANVASSHELARQMEGWTYVELPTGHNAMLSMPGELVTLLAAID